jgi:hypothetical protein
LTWPKYNRLVNETRFQIGCGHHAFILSSKPLVPVLRNPVINKITDKWRDNYESIQQWPQPVQLPGDFERRPAFIVRLSVHQQYDTQQLIFIETMQVELLLTELRL